MPTQDIVEPSLAKGELNVSGSIAFIGIPSYQITTNYGFSDKMAINVVGRKGPSQSYYSGALGYYSRFGSKSFFDIYLGYGRGMGYSYEYSFNNNSNYIDSKYNKIFTSIGYHFKKRDRFQFDLNLGINLIDFSDIYVFDEQTYLTDLFEIIDKSYFLFIEPSMRLTYKHQFFNSFYGVQMVAFEQNKYILGANVYVGLSVPIGMYLNNSK